jgi:hypothetical protein
MTIIDVQVTINEKGDATYGSSSKQVLPDGTITIETGESASITFAPASGQTWTFQSPWISIVANTPGIDDVAITSEGSAAVSIADINPEGTKASSYTYTLYTTAGDLDPAILNKGR